MKPTRRRGFTLIEILTAVGIIAILASIFFMGFNYVQRKARQDQSKIALQTLKAMLVEYEVQGASMAKLDEFHDGTNPKYTPAMTPLPNPGAVFEGGSGRDGDAVKRTRAVMKRLLAIPGNQKLLAQLPDAQVSKANDPDAVKSDMIWRTDDGIVFLDAHRNPIIFVPRRGLLDVKQGGNTLKITAPDARDQKSLNSTAVEFQGSPFFASAGEDGDFSKGDDNDYSFR